MLVLLALAIAGGLVYAWLPKPVGVEVTTVRRTDLSVEVAEEGQTRVRDRFVVAAPISGNLQRIDLEPGASVAAGAALARIEPPDPALLDERTRSEAEAHLAAARAHQRRAQTAIARAQLARDSAARETTRTRKLLDHAAVPATELERAELAEQLAIRDLAAAETDRASAIAEVAAARAVLGTPDHTGRNVVTVTAPTSGEVLRIVRDSAGPVLGGSPLLELGDLSALEIVIDVLSSDATQIEPGMPVAIEGWGGAPLAAKVRHVEPSAFTRISALGVEEQRVKVIAELVAPAPRLGDGFRVEARIFTWHGASVLVIPANAAFRDRGAWAVYVVENGRARLRPIEMGHRGRLDVEVTRGLAEGAQIVLHPSDRVRDGARVEVR
ncbi:MAG TPA: efflux RND transporter periplasmic adaptor subunit [Kofleriaceae bacterium]